MIGLNAIGIYAIGVSLLNSGYIVTAPYTRTLGLKSTIATTLGVVSVR